MQANIINFLDFGRKKKKCVLKWDEGRKKPPLQIGRGFRVYVPLQNI
jgi:hypothetical protein